MLPEEREEFLRDTEITHRQMLNTGLFEELRLIENGSDAIWEGTLSNGDTFYARTCGGSTSLTIEWKWNPEILLSTYEERDYSRRLAQGFQFPFHQKKIVNWCSDFLKGSQNWDCRFYYPGEATLFAIPLIPAIQAAMEEHGKTHSEIDEFGKNIISQLKERDEWTCDNESCSRKSLEHPDEKIKLVIATESKFDNVDTVREAFEANTIVYVPRAVGYYHLFAIDYLSDEKVCKQLVNGWLL